MLTLYFSGTGNSKYLAERFSEIMGGDCYSIEEEVDFENLITTASTIAFSYPIYGSCVPQILREFVTKNKNYLNEKKLIIFCTQAMFSGDGARVFIELLEGINFEVIYAEHFNMPNNIGNIPVLPIKNREQIKKAFKKVDKKLYKTCENIKNEVIKKRGFNAFSKGLGFYSQRKYFLKSEERKKKDVKISPDCIACSKCVEVCPMKNLQVIDKKIEQKGKCTLCYRCVNICPNKAITVLIHSKVKKQYKGVDGKLFENVK
ncbi:EFR1 family ferrodoxin [Herbivorax sp. ANBcel31]|uniref:EFR1 family ferrodoxin n=1 Tax=Herbivorax sp. ANBcel31 TaxID=3069754 RepID=UPI0027B070BE|nr:EFR1 family ferrodoxin [Herbivorax sp. ANBcel31]MDQ2087303.1 EFR1 family ferrodoxin [Herbivorax sp. ANBcel31]